MTGTHHKPCGSVEVALNANGHEAESATRILILNSRPRCRLAPSLRKTDNTVVESLPPLRRDPGNLRKQSRHARLHESEDSINSSALVKDGRAAARAGNTIHGQSSHHFRAIPLRLRNPAAPRTEYSCVHCAVRKGRSSVMDRHIF